MHRVDPESSYSGGAPVPPGMSARNGDVHRATAARLEHLQSITDSALGYMGVEDMLSELLERIRGILSVDTAAVLLLDEDRRVLVARAARGLEEEVRQGVQVPFARGFAGRVAAQVRPIVIEDLSRADVVNPILRQRGITSMLGVPIHVEGRVIGVMHVGSLTRRLFDQEDVALLQLAADKAALAIDNAALSEQRAVTRIMQRMMLPEVLPTLPGLRFSAKYLPAGSGVRIGGDWYDVFQLPNGRLTFVIGDVVGRGVMAASVMAEVRVALRAYLLEGHELSDVMSLLNELLFSMGRNRSATAAIAELDLESGMLELVSAGHLPALIVSDGGQARFLDQPAGLPLGFSSGGEYGSTREELASGNTLLLYTDGLVERRGESIEEGMGRLQRAAADAARASDSDFADRVYRALLAAEALEDDVALLAIEAVPLGERLELTLPAQADELAGLRRTLSRWLKGQGLNEDERFNVTLATSEAAGNAIEHAYGAREATFTVIAERDDAVVRVTVKDNGRWRDSSPYGRGRGLAIMRALVDSLDVRRGEDGTTVVLTKHCGSAGP